MIDLAYYPWTARLTMFLFWVVLAYVLPIFNVYPPRYRHFISPREFRAAYRSARWFGWQPGPILLVLQRVGLLGCGVLLALPELFGTAGG